MIDIIGGEESFGSSRGRLLVLSSSSLAASFGKSSAPRKKDGLPNERVVGGRKGVLSVMLGEGSF